MKLQRIGVRTGGSSSKQMNGVKHEYLDSTRLVLAILDHYFSISKVLNSISRRVPTIDLTWVLTRVIVESVSFLWIAIASLVIRQSLQSSKQAVTVSWCSFHYKMRAISILQWEKLQHQSKWVFIILYLSGIVVFRRSCFAISALSFGRLEPAWLETGLVFVAVFGPSTSRWRSRQRCGFTCTTPSFSWPERPSRSAPFSPTSKASSRSFRRHRPLTNRCKSCSGFFMKFC